MNLLKNGNWGLKILALVLAIVIYHALKDGAVRTNVTYVTSTDQQQQH